MSTPSKPFIILLFVTLILGGGAIGIFLGDPQWNGPLYTLQWRIYGEEPKMPENYTGLWRQWYKDGSLSEKCEYLNGRPHGLHVGWYRSGTKRIEGRYENGEPVGTHNDYYHTSGKGPPSLGQKTVYTATGFTMVSFYESGTIQSEFIKDDMKRERILRYYDKVGNPRSTRTIRWDEDGKQTSNKLMIHSNLPPSTKGTP